VTGMTQASVGPRQAPVRLVYKAAQRDREATLDRCVVACGLEMDPKKLGKVDKD
jgi:hypothetical protein